MENNETHPELPVATYDEGHSKGDQSREVGQMTDREPVAIKLELFQQAGVIFVWPQNIESITAGMIGRDEGCEIQMVSGTKHLVKGAAETVAARINDALKGINLND